MPSAAPPSFLSLTSVFAIRATSSRRTAVVRQVADIGHVWIACAGVDEVKLPDGVVPRTWRSILVPMWSVALGPEHYRLLECDVLWFGSSTDPAIAVKADLIDAEPLAFALDQRTALCC